MQKKIEKLLIAITIMFLFAVITLSVSTLVNWKQTTIVCTLITIALLFALLYIFIKKIIKLTNILFLSLITLATLTPRLIWVFLVHTKPFSDFLHMHNFAAKATEGIYNEFVKFYSLFPFKFGYGFFLAGVYKIFGVNPLASRIINTILSILMVLLIYKIARVLFGEAAGRLSAILSALWPSQIMYCSVTASEHIFIVLFLMGVYFIIKGLKNVPQLSIKDSNDNSVSFQGTIFQKVILKTKYFGKNLKELSAGLWFFAGALIAFAQLIRPVAIVVIVAVIIIQFSIIISELIGSSNANITSKLSFFKNIKNLFTSKEEYTKVRLIFTLKSTLQIALLLIGFISVFYSLSIPMSKLTGVPVWKASSGINLYIGTNFKSTGMWNKEDFSIIEEFNYDYDKVQNEATKRALDRIISNPKAFLKLSFNKFKVLWADETYGFYWSTISIDDTSEASKNVIKYASLLRGASQGYYIFILILALVGAYKIFKKNRFVNKISNTEVSILGVNFLAISILGFVGAYLFLEVQGRYHFPVIPFIIVFAGAVSSYKKN